MSELEPTMNDYLEAAEAGEGTTGDPILDQAKRRFRQCTEWEAAWRVRFIEDIKFSIGDSDNFYQWPNAVRRARDVDSRPCLTMNIIRQHNLQIINESKRDKSQVDIVPTGNGATVESAQMFGMIVDRIQYQSSAQNAYSVGQEFQVYGGIGYWRIVTDYADSESFDQEIFIRPINDPLTVYLDPDAKERDGSDAKFGFIFDTMQKEEFREAYPKWAYLASMEPMGASAADDDWMGKDHVRVCEYFRKVPKEDKVLNFVDPSSGKRKSIRASRLHKSMLAKVLDDPQTRQRSVFDDEVEWHLIVGSTIIDKTIWPGKYIPIIRCLGEEMVVDGIMDRKGHTRYMKDSQRMYNYNASGQVEFVALQSKSPWFGAAAAIEEHESMWNTANVANHSFLPFNHLDDEGNPLPPQALPQRMQPPTSSPAFEAGMQTAFNQAMMVSGQWQNQMGMQGNERTGAAIEKRQDQGDTATYHFRANYDCALIYTGKQLIDLIPHIYDTERVVRIQAQDGTDLELELDPGAKLPYLQQVAHNGEVARRIFNPVVGSYDVRSQPGKAFGTKREETVNALTLILTQAPALTGVIGDLLLQAMDFKEAKEAAQRLKRMVPPQALGTGPSQQEQLLQQQLVQTKAALVEALQKLGKEQLKLSGKDQMRDIDVYKAETDRFKALSDMMMLDQGGIQQVVEQTVREAANTHLGPILDANAPEIDSQGAAATPPAQGASGKSVKAPTPIMQSGAGAPPMPGAKRAPDGQWYVPDPSRPGKFLQVAPKGGQGP